jgi:CDP-diacylglycerol--serine O-phosphatidyltransferase
LTAGAQKQEQEHVMETPFPSFEPNGPNDEARGPRLREIPLRLIVPNVITVLAICAGLSGVRLAFENRFELAVAMVLVAAFLDGIDGRVARLMKATSKFGAQMDSLADIVNFGVAPALVLYAFVLDQARSLGWIAALIYVIAAGLRLARFNVMAEREVKASWQSEYFVGVPAPAGAMLVLLPMYLGLLGLAPDRVVALVSSGYTVLIAFLLVSRLPVWSGKSENRVRRDLVLPIILFVVLYVATLMSFTWETMAITAVGYLISLPFGARKWQKKYGDWPLHPDHPVPGEDGLPEDKK